jgi:arsenate reductase
MLEGYLKNIKPNWHVNSAGIKPAQKTDPLAIKIMKEDGVDITSHRPSLASSYFDQTFDYVITVCDEAKNECPSFVGKTKHRVHMPFQNPAKISGTEKEKLDVFRNIRDKIKKFAESFVQQLSLSNPHSKKI